MTFTSENVRATVVSGSSHSLWDVLGTLAVLFKLRIVLLLLFAAWGGAMLGSSGRPSLEAFALLTLTGAMAAGGSGALNQYLERDRDTLMARTKRRPLATGEIKPVWALLSGVGLVAGAVLLALLAGNSELAFFLGLGAVIYVGVYTLWLKPRTLLNVIIGGAAGSAAVLSGSAAVGDWANSGAVILAALLFTWSPSHFWSLALVYRKDYAKVDVPMLPVVMEPGRAVGWTLVHMALTGLFALLLATQETLGLLYLAPIGAATIWLAKESYLLIRRGGHAQQAMTLFKVSNIYLALVLLFICIAALL